MNRSHNCRVSVAALRPWPFGPPLRGRATVCYADSLPAIRKARQSTRPQALAPAGGLTWTLSNQIYGNELRNIDQKVSNRNQDLTPIIL
jgi:hypothetical protein